MPSTVIKSVGPGRDFPTLTAFAAALPLDLVALDEIWVAELHAEADDPGGAIIQAVCDATRYVILRAAPGQGFSDLMDPDSDPLVPTPGLGALIRAINGAGVSVQGASTRVEVSGLQIVAESGAALADDGVGAFFKVDRCVLEANGAGPAVVIRGTGSEISNSGVIQRGSGDGMALMAGTRVLNCTVVKPDASIATGTGVSASGAPAPEVHSVAAFGFRQDFGDGIGTADALAADQTNLLSVPDDFSDPYWAAIGSIVDTFDTSPGPFSVPLQWVRNNGNAFARFDGPNFVSVAPGERVAFSAIVAQPSSLISAIVLASAAGNPELRITWSAQPPTVTLLGQTAALQLVTGTLSDLGNDTWRLLLEAENTTGAPVDVLARFYVTRGVENTGLNVGMYAGALMAGLGHLGTGFVYPGSVPGTNPLEGLVPSEAILSSVEPGLDLRPVAAGPLEGQAPIVSPSDLYLRYREAPDTIGAVSLNTAPVLHPAGLSSALTISGARIIDSNDILSAHRRRTVLPASPGRGVGV